MNFMLSIRSITSLCALIMLSACAIQDYLPTGTVNNAQTFTAPIKFYANNSNTPIDTPELDLNVWLPGISGNFYGTANSEAVLQATPSKDSHYRFKLDRALEQQVSKQARPILANTDTSNTLSAEPADTRLLRIASLVNHPYTGDVLGDTLWMDTKRHSALMLVYTDRATHISGSVSIDNKRLNHNITLPAAGFYWLRQIRQRKNTALLVASSAPKAIELGIIQTKPSVD